jgi:hypothetical protein
MDEQLFLSFSKQDAAAWNEVMKDLIQYAFIFIVQYAIKICYNTWLQFIFGFFQVYTNPPM